MKYVSKENLEQYDSLIKLYILDKANDVELLAYGVEWDSTVANPEVTRIGNPLLHKLLPILSAMRGCICQDDKIMYYLNPDNWYLKESDNKEFSGTADWFERLDIAVGTKGDTVRAKKFDLLLTFDGYTIGDDNFDKNLTPDPGQYIIIYKPENPNIYAVYVTYETVNYYGVGFLRFPQSLEVFNNGLEIGNNLSGTAVTIVFGANHSGYDGTVLVEIPEWYLWSEVDGNKRRVWCSLNKVVPYAKKIPHMLMDAHRNTVLRSTTTGMGYLDTLPANSAICVTNYQPYCRGGANNSAYDSKLYTYPEMSDLGKPVSGMTRATLRTWCKNANREPLCYEYYKALFVWLYVIEYANRNCLAAYNAELTLDGYRLGGLGAGVTNLNYAGEWHSWSRLTSVDSCGAGNSIGNNTGLINHPEMHFEATTSNIPLTSAIAIYNTFTKDIANNSITFTHIANSQLIRITDYSIQMLGEYKYIISGLLEGLKIYFRCGTVVLATATLDGEITVNWEGHGSKYIYSNFVGDCNLTITNTVVAENFGAMFHLSQYNIPRWRGFDDIFGNIWTNLDGVVIQQPELSSTYKNVYTTTNSEDFKDSIEKMNLVGKEIRTDGIISDLDLGSTAEIIPSEVKSNSYTSHMCDLHYVGSNNTVIRTLLVGGRADYSGRAGLFCFYSTYGVSDSNSAVGWRSLKVLK